MTRLPLALICAMTATACDEAPDALEVADYLTQPRMSSMGPTTMDEPLPDGCKRVHDGAQLWRVCQ